MIRFTHLFSSGEATILSVSLFGLGGGYSLPFGSAWAGTGGIFGTLGKYRAPLTPHPMRDIMMPKLKVRIRIAIMNVSKTND